jgi:predicted Fe-Mo cluster-binding NifX family protein
MKICIASQGDNAGSSVSERFARCNYWAFADTESGDIEFEENRFKNDMHGAGSEAGEFLTERGVKAVITGRVGPNARRLLDAAGITAYAPGNRTVGEALEAFNGDTLERLN